MWIAFHFHLIDLIYRTSWARLGYAVVTTNLGILAAYNSKGLFPAHAAGSLQSPSCWSSLSLGHC